APIILTEQNKLSDSAQKELKRLSVKNVFIVGGTGVVSTDVENQIKSLGINPTRIAGTNRYKTSFEVAKYLDKNPKAIAVATGNNFADALSFSSIAAMKGDPILLTAKDSIDDGIKQYINDNSSTITTSYVIGGTGAVSDSVLNSLKNPIRLSGKNRYETNTAVLNYFKKDLDLSNVYLATGNDFPDALASSVLASNSKTPILLINSGVDASTISFVNDNTASIKNITAIGGTNAVSDELLKDVSENFVNYVISFRDTNLQNAIDEILNKKDSEPILKKETDKITTLNLNEKSVHSLEGIQYLTNLTSLSSQANNLKDLTPLSNLTNLTQLYLSYNSITDLTPLSNLTNLTQLYLSDNQITDFAPLYNLKNLTYISMEYNNIEDLSFFSNFTNLTKLDLSYNKITDLTPLSKITNLTKLDLSNNNITDLTPLNNLKNLTELYITNNKITDLTPLNNLLNLTKLALFYNNITDITPLSTLTNLIDLDLSENNISDFTSLSKLANLSSLGLVDTSIKDLSPLSNLTNLTILALSGDNLTDLSSLSKLTNLTYFYLSRNKITDLSFFNKFIKLKRLDLSQNNPPLDANALSALKTALPNCDILN
ncbi:MAG: leucine-rich repeat domain-containing protein, partial [Bacillota bacterium]|nr:leucine-rich repeat domain-containing protein [Bacillota bacterium]